MEENQAPALAVEEEWILKYRAALNAELTKRSHGISIRKFLRRTLDHFVPASECFLYQYLRQPLEKVFAVVRKELPHLY